MSKNQTLIVFAGVLTFIALTLSTHGIAEFLTKRGLRFEPGIFIAIMIGMIIVSVSTWLFRNLIEPNKDWTAKPEPSRDLISRREFQLSNGAWLMFGLFFFVVVSASVLLMHATFFDTANIYSNILSARFAASVLMFLSLPLVLAGTMLQIRAERWRSFLAVNDKLASARETKSGADPSTIARLEDVYLSIISNFGLFGRTGNGTISESTEGYSQGRNGEGTVHEMQDITFAEGILPTEAGIIFVSRNEGSRIILDKLISRGADRRKNDRGIEARSEQRKVNDRRRTDSPVLG